MTGLVSKWLGLLHPQSGEFSFLLAHAQPFVVLEEDLRLVDSAFPTPWRRGARTRRWSERWSGPRAGAPNARLGVAPELVERSIEQTRTTLIR